VTKEAAVARLARAVVLQQVPCTQVRETVVPQGRALAADTQGRALVADTLALARVEERKTNLADLAKQNQQPAQAKEQNSQTSRTHTSADHLPSPCHASASR